MTGRSYHKCEPPGGALTARIAGALIVFLFRKIENGPSVMNSLAPSGGRGLFELDWQTRQSDQVLQGRRRESAILGRSPGDLTVGSTAPPIYWYEILVLTIFWLTPVFNR